MNRLFLDFFIVPYICYSWTDLKPIGNDRQLAFFLCITSPYHAPLILCSRLVHLFIFLDGSFGYGIRRVELVTALLVVVYYLFYKIISCPSFFCFYLFFYLSLVLFRIRFLFMVFRICCILTVCYSWWLVIKICEWFNIDPCFLSLFLIPLFSFLYLLCFILSFFVCSQLLFIRSINDAEVIMVLLQ